ncbi:MAG: LytTR family DNA-binding domain-containing protein [Cellulosilyticaceae bacterium]
MKIRIEIEDGIAENEVIIRCSELSAEVAQIQRALSEICLQTVNITFYKDNTEYYIGLDEILFFETEASGINAHTCDSVYQVKYKLYELEELLPRQFMRVSKSSILNISKIYAIERSLTAASTVEFQNTYKKVYVSRNYYKALKNKLLEVRR